MAISTSSSLKVFGWKDVSLRSVQLDGSSKRESGQFLATDEFEDGLAMHRITLELDFAMVRLGGRHDAVGSASGPSVFEDYIPVLEEARSRSTLS